MSAASSTPLRSDPLCASAVATWRASSRSQSTNCVEVAGLDTAAGPVAIRDSKDRGGTVLVFARARWLEFVAAAKDGEFDRGLTAVR
jgi:hypothetical protein